MLEMYKKHSGKMSAVIDSIMLATEGKERRLCDYNTAVSSYR